MRSGRCDDITAAFVASTAACADDIDITKMPLKYENSGTTQVLKVKSNTNATVTVTVDCTFLQNEPLGDA
jgi:hypothetical protein